MQEGMLYHKRMDEHTRFFFLQQCIQMDGQICETTLRQALALLSKRHEVLRTLFLYKKTEHPRQIILTEREIECRTVDLSGAGAGAKMAMNALLAEEQARGFDLEKDSLLRITLIDLPARQSVLVLNAHHIILDGWCFVMLFGDLKRYYEALSAGTSFSSLQASIAKTRRQTPDFGDYLARMERQDRRAGLSFWKEYLSDYMAPPRTPMAPPQNGNSETKKRTRAETRILGRDVGDPLSRLAARLEATVSTVLEAVWSILLMRRNHRRDVVFGKVISGRDLDMEAADRIVGIFINTIPVRATLAPGRTAARFIRELHEGSLSAMPFSDCALAEIQQQNPSGSRLIETLFIHENQFNYDPSVHKSTRTFGGMDCQIKPMTEHVGYPLAVKTALPGKLLLEILYEEPFDRREIVLMMDRFIAILMEIVADPEIEVDQIAALPERERTLVLRDFNRTVAPWPSEQTLAALVEAQVKRRPEQTALLFQDQAIRYDQLNRQANRLAHRLQQMGIGPEDRVMVSAPRSPLILVAMLAILKAGGCYLPVDPGDPDERIRFILADSEAKILLTTEDRFSTLNLPLLNLTDEETFLDPAENPAPVARPSHLACCVYTSGTTGYPKGVLVEHRNMVSYCMADNPFTDAVEVAPSPVILSTTSFCFDPFVTESLMALMRGWTILLADDETAEDQILLSRLAAAHGATALQTTPARLKLLMTWPEHRGYLNHLTAIGIGGEPFPGGLFTLIRRYTDAQIFNLYGLTETTVWSTVAPLDSEEIHIGKPGPNEMICIMDGWKPCGVGIPGELCIGGAGVARGYLNRPALSKEKFIKNPFWPGRMFRTGDLARWLPDGNLVHMGRMDDQIKLRGYRIEPAEIEGAMGRLPAVEHAAAALRPDPAGEPMLVGYVVSRASLDGNELQSMLRKTLPEYMIPAHILQIPALPLNRNGKVDRQALPTPAPSASVLAPLQSEEEKQIGAVFAAVLNLKTVSLHDNFFTLGGHSLRAARAAWLLEKQTGVRIPLRQWFDTPTVKGLARVLLEKKNPPPAAPRPHNSAPADKPDTADRSG